MDKARTPKPEKNSQEVRQYIRLKSVFPVECVFLDVVSGREIFSPQLGFTSNISRGGICLNTYHLPEEILKRLQAKDVHVNLKISIPLNRPALAAKACVAWLRESGDASQSKYDIGLRFIHVEAAGLNGMLKEAQWLKWTSDAAVVVACVAAFFLAGSMAYNFQLRKANQEFITRFVASQEKETTARKTLESIENEQTALSEAITRYENEVARLQEELKIANADLEAGAQQAQGLQDEIEKLKGQKDPLENEYAALLQRQEGAALTLKDAEEVRGYLQTEIVERMYRWLLNHQNVSTGLVLSFEGDAGVIKDWAFTYDQALAANVFLLFKNPAGAKKIFNFFYRKEKENFVGFHNAYYVDSGEVAEHAIHCGPNIWLGIAVMQYTQKTGDAQYLPLARRIASWLMAIQDQDAAGGLRGGPQFSWFSTEHNLDAYAFFGMLYQMTREEPYNIAQEKTLSWLKNYAMTPHSDDYKIPPVKRGRGDATIATDTFAWSLASLGPETLLSIGMNPREIMDFAQKQCEVKGHFKRPDGSLVEVSGFDFAKPGHVARGGIISSEWSAQMVISYQVLSRFFLKGADMAQARDYQEKADSYLKELNKLIIASPSAKGQGEGCLPYATKDDADTGHGWRTPQGTSTGSVAGTAYMLMALKGFNPLMLGGVYE